MVSRGILTLVSTGSCKAERERTGEKESARDRVKADSLENLSRAKRQFLLRGNKLRDSKSFPNRFPKAGKPRFLF